MTPQKGRYRLQLPDTNLKKTLKNESVSEPSHTKLSPIDNQNLILTEIETTQTNQKLQKKNVQNII